MSECKNSTIAPQPSISQQGSSLPAQIATSLFIQATPNLCLGMRPTSTRVDRFFLFVFYRCPTLCFNCKYYELHWKSNHHTRWNNFLFWNKKSFRNKFNWICTCNPICWTGINKKTKTTRSPRAFGSNRTDQFGSSVLLKVWFLENRNRSVLFISRNWVNSVSVLSVRFSVPT